MAKNLNRQPNPKLRARGRRELSLGRFCKVRRFWTRGLKPCIFVASAPLPFDDASKKMIGSSPTPAQKRNNLKPRGLKPQNVTEISFAPPARANLHVKFGALCKVRRFWPRGLKPCIFVASAPLPFDDASKKMIGSSPTPAQKRNNLKPRGLKPQSQTNNCLRRPRAPESYLKVASARPKAT